MKLLLMIFWLLLVFFFFLSLLLLFIIAFSLSFTIQFFPSHRHHHHHHHQQQQQKDFDLFVVPNDYTTTEKPPQRQKVEKNLGILGEYLRGGEEKKKELFCFVEFVTREVYSVLDVFIDGMRFYFLFFYFRILFEEKRQIYLLTYMFLLLFVFTSLKIDLSSMKNGEEMKRILLLIFLKNMKKIDMPFLKVLSFSSFSFSFSPFVLSF